MINYYTYYSYKSIFNNKFCQKIIDLGLKKIEENKKNKKSTNATTFGKDLTKKKNDKRRPLNDKSISDLNIKKENETYIRDSEVSWLSNQFIYDEVFPLVRNANQKAGWNYQFDFAESCQFTKYGLNQFYGWHIDGGSDDIAAYSKDKNKNKKLYNINSTNLTSDDNWNNKVRKLSVTINLSTESSYEGGNLKFDLGPHHTKDTRYVECTEIRPRGSMIVFPSFNYHQVTPVTKGTRYSLVIWFLGKPFQ